MHYGWSIKKLRRLRARNSNAGKSRNQLLFYAYTDNSNRFGSFVKYCIKKKTPTNNNWWATAEQTINTHLWIRSNWGLDDAKNNPEKTTKNVLPNRLRNLFLCAKWHQKIACRRQFDYKNKQTRRLSWHSSHACRIKLHPNHGTVYTFLLSTDDYSQRMTKVHFGFARVGDI